MPDKDRDRIYRVKEATLAKLLIRILGISSVSEDAISLTKWKQPSGDAPAGDFPACVYYVLNKRSTQTQASTMTIDEVNNKLDKLVMAHKEYDL
jgi:TATA-binding protein-associated factor Taf7